MDLSIFKIEQKGERKMDLLEEINRYPGIADKVNKLGKVKGNLLNKKLMAEAKLTNADIEFVGMATPGTANSATGVIEYANNLPFFMYPMCEKLGDMLGGLKVYIENDANAAAKAEAMAGVAKDAKYSVMITLGTGVGGGIVLDGQVYAGFNFAGAELGHIVIEKDGRPCSCGRKGCWEAYSSATGLINMTRDKIDECIRTGRPTLMLEMTDGGKNVSGRTSFNAMRAGDEAAKEVVDEYISYLACGLINIVNIFQPEIISLGGGVSNERENLLKPLLPLIEAQQYGAGAVPQTEIRIAQLGNDAGIIGAALLGMQK
jgi:glucokinase